MEVKSVVFDLDNTLWDCDSVIVNAERKFYFWLEQSHPEIKENFNEEELVEHRVSYMQSRPEFHYNLTYLRKEWLRELASEVLELSIDSTERFIQTSLEIFKKERNSVVLYDGVIDMLESLSQKYSLGVITNGNADLNVIGIAHYFDFALSSEEAGVSKPHEDIFYQAMKLSKYELENSIYVGDDPKCDVLGPQRIGMRALWYNPSLKPWPGGQVPTGVFRSHDELEDKISRL